jgi:hypothetical protein
MRSAVGESDRQSMARTDAGLARVLSSGDPAWAGLTIDSKSRLRTLMGTLMMTLSTMQAICVFGRPPPGTSGGPVTGAFSAFL